MTSKFNEGALERAAAVVPFAVWMAMLFTLPATAESYCLRTLVCAVLLGFFCLLPKSRALGAVFDFGGRHSARGTFASVMIGVAAGLAVLAIWVAPERFGWYREWLVIGDAPADVTTSPYAPSVCGWPLTLARLAGSAFVIAPIEELFFRSFLYRSLQGGGWGRGRVNVFDLQAFLWTVGLFTVEHDRPVVAAITGAIYGMLAIRRGLGTAVIAHAVTNFALGAYVFATGEWAFW